MAVRKRAAAGSILAGRRTAAGRWHRRRAYRSGRTSSRHGLRSELGVLLLSLVRPSRNDERQRCLCCLELTLGRWVRLRSEEVCV